MWNDRNNIRWYITAKNIKIKQISITSYSKNILSEIKYENRNLLYVCQSSNTQITKFNYECTVSSTSFSGTNINLPNLTPK